MDMVSGMNDLKYVDKKLLGCCFSQTKVGLVQARPCQIANPIAQYHSHFSLESKDVDDFSETDESEALEPISPHPLNMVSPDSDVPCDSPECPSRDFPHSIGRYFHNGHQPPSPAPPGFEAESRGAGDHISNTFNRTIPPPAIITAYIRTCVGLHDQADSDMVRQYQKHHMYSPITTEPSTLWPRDVFPEMHGLYSQEGSCRVNEDLEAGKASQDADDIIVQDMDLECSSDQDSVKRPLQPSDFEDSDDENDAVVTSLRSN